MLTFKRAPNTLLGPCEHALWNGGVFLSRHHMHMPDGVEAWQAAVNRLVKSSAIEHITAMVADDMVMRESIRTGDRSAHSAALARWILASRKLDKVAKVYGVV